MTDELKGLIAKAATGATLSREEAAHGFDTMMSGEATPSQMGALLMALRVRGETVDEITGAVTAMREKMLRVAAPPDAIDVVGTGGDASRLSCTTHYGRHGPAYSSAADSLHSSTHIWRYDPLF